MGRSQGDGLEGKKSRGWPGGRGAGRTNATKGLTQQQCTERLAQLKSTQGLTEWQCTERLAQLICTERLAQLQATDAALGLSIILYWICGIFGKGLAQLQATEVALALCALHGSY
eukprot:scaffold5508_cov21-Tisochrysis_lutea.AAC.4